MKNEVATLTSQDLTAVGISSQLTSNDLIEVVANDIYDKYIESVNDNIKRSGELIKRWVELFNPEIEVMKQDLQKSGFITLDDKENVSTSYNPEKSRYWENAISIKRLRFVDKDKGVKVDENDTTLSYTKGASIKIKISVTVNEYSKEKEVSMKGIEGTIETTINKQFQKTISTTDNRFKKLIKEVQQHNEEVKNIVSFLPVNGIISVERFTSEARVKMNKKIISAQSPDFRKKISELFNIKL